VYNSDNRTTVLGWLFTAQKHYKRRNYQRPKTGLRVLETIKSEEMSNIGDKKEKSCFAFLPSKVEGKWIWLKKYTGVFEYQRKLEYFEDVIEDNLFTEKVQTGYRLVDRWVRVNKKPLTVNESINKSIEAVKNRIVDEYRKHGEMGITEVAEIAARKIVKSMNEAWEESYDRNHLKPTK
jgi:hypothetical protein